MLAQLFTPLSELIGPRPLICPLSRGNCSFRVILAGPLRCGQRRGQHLWPTIRRRSMRASSSCPRRSPRSLGKVTTPKSLPERCRPGRLPGASTGCLRPGGPETSAFQLWPALIPSLGPQLSTAIGSGEVWLPACSQDYDSKIETGRQRAARQSISASVSPAIAAILPGRVRLVQQLPPRQTTTSARCRPT